MEQKYPTREQAAALETCSHCETCIAWRWCQGEEADGKQSIGSGYTAMHDALDAKDAELTKAQTIISARQTEIDGLVDEFATCVAELAKATHDSDIAVNAGVKLAYELAKDKDLIKRMADEISDYCCDRDECKNCVPFRGFIAEAEAMMKGATDG